jgi:DNA polymerase (family X)
VGPERNQELAGQLRELARLLSLSGESVYRVRAYERAADRLEALEVPADVLLASGELTQVPGIGERLASHIEELARTGSSRMLTALRRRFPPGIGELTRVGGLGPRRAAALAEHLGISDLEGLERAVGEGRVREVPGFGEVTERRLGEELERLRGLAGATHPPRRHRLGDVLEGAQGLVGRLRAGGAEARAELSGEVRRACETVRSVEIVAAGLEPERLLSLCRSAPAVRGVAWKDGVVEGWLGEAPLRVHLAQPKSFAWTWLWTTASEQHRAQLEARGAADSATYQQARQCESEARIYATLGLAEIPPELREGEGEVELAARGPLPELVKLEDVVGVVHSHSTWSDGRATLEQMALAAKERGLLYLTVTEHSQSAGYAGGLTEAALQRQWAEIDELNARLQGIRLLKGIESDILADGSLDFPDELLEQLDVVIGSVHQRHKMDAAQMTGRLLRALDHPHLHILGHPTGRLIQHRDPYAADMEAVIAKASERGVAIEVNGNPARLDLKAEHVRLALGLGARLVVSADAHSVRELDHLRYAVATARRGGARRQDVLNTVGPSEFARALKQMRA